MTESEVRIGEVIWYNKPKGDRFVKIDNAEVFIHHERLYPFGLIHQLPGDQVSVSLATIKLVQVIQDLLTNERSPNPAPPITSKPDEGETRAMVNALTTFVAMVL